VFKGRVSDQEKETLYSSSHYVLIPSRFESFGLMAIEGLRSGTPFIAACSGGLLETAQSCKASETVSDNNPQNWIAKLLEVLSRGVDEAERRRPECRSVFLEKFTAARMAHQSICEYRSLLQLPDPSKA
jgi:glycogen synthase